MWSSECWSWSLCWVLCLWSNWSWLSRPYCRSQMGWPVPVLDARHSLRADLGPDSITDELSSFHWTGCAHLVQSSEMEMQWCTYCCVILLLLCSFLLSEYHFTGSLEFWMLDGCLEYPLFLSGVCQENILPEVVLAVIYLFKKVSSLVNKQAIATKQVGSLTHLQLCWKMEF